MLYLDPLPLGRGIHVPGHVLALNVMHLRSDGVPGKPASCWIRFCLGASSQLGGAGGEFEECRRMGDSFSLDSQCLQTGPVWTCPLSYRACALPAGAAAAVQPKYQAGLNASSAYYGRAVLGSCP